jgi:hypothetical protein
MGDRTWQTWKTYLASFVVNRILATPWGLSFGAQGERVIPDVNFFLTPWTYNQPYRDYWDVRSFLALRYLNSEGWQGGVKVTLLQQYLKGWSDGPFALVDLTFGKEFAKKRGMASIEVTNLFNQHFFFVLEPNVFNQTIYPARRILFKLAFYF